MAPIIPRLPTHHHSLSVGRKSLQQHRLHKSPVKVEFYASADGATDLRQLLGYVVLDTRSAREKAPGAEVRLRRPSVCSRCSWTALCSSVCTARVDISRCGVRFL